MNIVDLGLIYSLEIKPQEDGGNLVEVKMTLTAPGCGMGPSIASDAQRKILSVPGVTDAQVDVVWDPPWSAERISQEGKQKLGMAVSRTCARACCGLISLLVDYFFTVPSRCWQPPCLLSASSRMFRSRPHAPVSPC